MDEVNEHNAQKACPAVRTNGGAEFEVVETSGTMVRLDIKEAAAMTMGWTE